MLLIDKPYEWTSFDVIREMRRLIKIKKIGHAGTLDPLATGLLIVCTGKFTKRINEFMAQEKEYTGSITLGATTPTFDLESEPVNFKDVSAITNDQINNATHPFIGDILQVPPMHSAIKKDGKRIYELARRGETIELEPRKLFIKNRLLLKRLKCRCCISALYVQRERIYAVWQMILALHWVCGGYLSSLCRTAIGDFKLENALTMQQVEQQVKNDLQKS